MYLSREGEFVEASIKETPGSRCGYNKGGPFHYMHTLTPVCPVMSRKKKKKKKIVDFSCVHTKHKKTGVDFQQNQTSNWLRIQYNKSEFRTNVE